MPYLLRELLLSIPGLLIIWIFANSWLVLPVSLFTLRPAMDGDDGFDYLFKIVLIGDMGVGKTWVIPYFLHFCSVFTDIFFFSFFFFRCIDYSLIIQRADTWWRLLSQYRFFSWILFSWILWLYSDWGYCFFLQCLFITDFIEAVYILQ